MEATLFTFIGSWIDEFFEFLKTSNTDVVQTLSSLFALTITIQIMFKAYQIFGGKTQEPLRELVWDMTIRIIIVGVALNLNGYLDVIKIAMENLQNIMSGNESLYASLDKKLNATMTLIESIWGKAGIAPGKNSIGLAIVAIICIALSFFMGILPASAIIIVTSITLQLLMLVLPIALFAHTYPWFRGVFQQWLSIFLSNLITVFILGITFTVFSEKYIEMIDKMNGTIDNGNVAVLTIMLDALVMGAMLLIITKVAKEIADKLGTASIETLVHKGISDSLPKRSSKPTPTKPTPSTTSTSQTPSTPAPTPPAPTPTK